MKKYLPIILSLATLKFIIQWVGNLNYGFHRDELLHLSVSEHLDWGYMEFPPLIGLIGKVSYILFDYSLWGVRLFPTLAGVAILVLCCLMALELGGKKGAVFIAGMCVLAFLPFYRNHTLFQPVAFDQLFWTLGFYFLLKYLNTQNAKYLLLVGLISGFGLLNKYTFVVWGFAIAVGIIFYENGKLYKTKWLYIAGSLAFLILLPNIIWQAQHDFPFLLHMKLLKEKQLSKIDPMEFGWAQLDYPFTLVVSIIGLIGIFIDQRLKKFRSLGIAALVAFFTMWFMRSKAYYIFSVYPVLFALGAVKIEIFFEKKSYINYILASIIFLPSIPLIPKLTPVLPIESFVDYSHLTEKDGRIELTGDYADMFGWEEQVQLVDSVFNSLSESEKKNCVLWGENYGEAGALKILGKKYGLPNPISRHGSFWLWGYDNKDAEVWISLGNETPSVEYVFEDVKLVKTITHKYAIGEENNIPLYICRKPKLDIDDWWKKYEKHVFD